MAKQYVIMYINIYHLLHVINWACTRRRKSICLTTEGLVR